VEAIGFCSVVPDINHSLVNACRKYFGFEPFVLRAGVKTGLKIRYKNPTEVGADRIAGAAGAVALHPGNDVIIIDLGTATTVEAVSADREYLGGAIAPGLLISVRALEQNTARLPKVEILRPEHTCGRSTVESIQSGLYYGQLGMLRELRDRLRRECYGGGDVVVLGTGGFARLFAGCSLFDEMHLDLALEGIRIIQQMNE
jgi:type III pantothenate kinase